MGSAGPTADSELYRVGTMMEGTCIRLADAVYASSALSATACASDYGRRPARVLHSGVDLERLMPAGDGRDEPVIAFVGRIGASKGADTLVTAACRLAGRVRRPPSRSLGPLGGRRGRAPAGAGDGCGLA